AFIIPYMFVLQPQLLMIDTTPLETGRALLTAMLGMIAIGAGMIGYWYRGLNWAFRTIAVVTGLLLIYPEGYTDLIGLGIFVLLVAYQITLNRRAPAQKGQQQAGA